MKPSKTLLASIIVSLFSINTSFAEANNNQTLNLTEDTIYTPSSIPDGTKDVYALYLDQNIYGNGYNLTIQTLPNKLFWTRMLAVRSQDTNISAINNLVLDDQVERDGNTDNGLIYAENTKTLTISASSLKATSTNAICLHSMGGTINVNANSIELTSNNRTALVVQPQNVSGHDGFATLQADKINITSYNYVPVNLFTVNSGNAELHIKGKEVYFNSLITNDDNYYPSSGVAVYDQLQVGADTYITGSGDLTLDIKADKLTVIGADRGFQIQRKTEDDTKTVASVYANTSVSVIGTQGALYVFDAHRNGNDTTLTIDAPEINLESTHGSTVYVEGSQANLGTQNGDKISKISINSENGYKAIETKAQSELKITNSTVDIKGGNVSSEGTLTLDNTRLSLGEKSDFETNTLSGTNSQIIVNSKNTNVNVGTNAATNLEVKASGTYADQFATAEAAYTALSQQTTINNGNSAQLGGEAGTVADAWTVKDGKIEVTRNASLEAFSQFNAMTLTQWRAENNHLSKRLGDVRSNRGEIGSWARIYGYDSSVKDNINIDVKATSIQVGGDVSVGKNWIIGGAFTYTDMSGDFDTGSSDADSYSLSAYATGLFECGGFIDVIGRVGRISTDISASTLSADGGVLAGSYDNTAFALSVETGYHWTPASIFYVEPQAELSYSYVLGDSFTSSANGVSIDQDDFQSLVGRFGAQIGASLPQDAGRIYVEASINHDFLGDADATATPAKGAARRLSSDLGSTWYSYGIGLQLNLTDRTSFYGSLDRANGNDYQEDYRYSVGLRHIW